MRWTRFGFGVLLLIWLGGCAGPGVGSGSGDTLKVGQRLEDLTARQGQPQEVQPGPDGGKIYIYTTYSLDQVAAMGGGAWNKPDQVYYWLNDQGVITRVSHYPYGKRRFLFPSDDKPAVAAPSTAAAAPSPVTPAAPAPAVAAAATPPAEIASPPQPPPLPEPQTTPSAAPASRPPSPEAVSPPPVATSGSPAKIDLDAASRLELNMSREEVRRLLGAPERTEGFRAAGRALIVWFYLLESRQGRRLLTPLVFEEGRLSGWGEEYYKRRLRALSGPNP